jgi:hypothetical protein
VWIDLFEPVSMNVKNNDLHFYPDTVIANKSYQNVFKVSKTNLKDNEKILWIIKARDIGIVQFYDEKTNKTWTLAE